LTITVLIFYLLVIALGFSSIDNSCRGTAFKSKKVHIRKWQQQR